MHMGFRFLLLLLCVVYIPACSAEEAMQTERLVIETASGDVHVFQIEIAASHDEWAQGLMHRQSMPADHGMLFIFPDVDNRRFWMKNTLIPLDMLFVNADGTIHHIHENAKPHDLSGVKSNGPVKAVLEINGGRARELGIQNGDRLLHPFFIP